MLLNTSRLSLYIPFCYFYFTRLKSITKLISWILIYILSQFLFVLNYEQCSGLEIANLILIVLCCYSIYEIGYIYNDVFTVKREQNPTIRLTTQLMKYCECNITSILSVRICVALISGWVALGYESIFYIFLIGLVFFVYNIVRSRINLILHFFLVFLRYSMPIVFILGPDVVLYTIFSFPLINLIERSSEVRFKFVFFNRLRSSLNEFRVLYYLVLVVIFISFSLTQYIYVFFYLLVIRSLFYLYDFKRAKVERRS